MSTCWPSQSFSEASPSTFYLHFIYQSVSPCPQLSSIGKGAWDIKIFSVSACCRSQQNCCSQFNSVQWLSCVWLFAIPWIAECQASLSITNSQIGDAQIDVHWVSDAIQPSHPLSSPFPSAFNLSQHLFQWISSSHQVAKVFELQFQHQPSNEYSGLISFRIDWFDLLTVQETLKSLLQHHSSKASILRCSAFFMVQLSHPYMTTGKIIGLTRQTFVGKVTSLLFNILSRLVITFLPRGKGLLISWLQSPSAVILEPNKIRSVTVSIVSPSICLEVMGPDTVILVFWMLSFKSAFHSPLSLSSWGSLVPLYFLS